MAKLGQPTKYREEFCQQLIDHMAQGFSFRTFATKIMIARSNLYRWVEEYPEFKEAKSLGEDLALQFFEKCKIDKMTGKNMRIDTGLVTFALKTRFHEEYGDKQKISADVTSDGEPVTITYNAKS